MKKRTIEDYVELIYNIQKTKKIVHTNDVASSFQINPASVTEMFQKLSDEGYINYERYSGVTLTEKGRKIAVKTQKRHDTLKSFLILLGVDESIADEDACKIEHNVNPETMNKLRNFVEFANLENVCTKWLDNYRTYDDTGDYTKCMNKNSQKCQTNNKESKN